MARWFLDRSHQAGIPTVSLRRLLPEARFVGCSDLEVTGCTSDARRLDPGQTFVALGVDGSVRGTEVGRALERGAAAVVVEEPLPDAGPLQVIVPNARSAYARINHALAGAPADRLPVIAVVGRESERHAAAWVLRSLLDACGLKQGYLGRDGWSDGSRFYPRGPEPILAEHLVEMLAAMADRGCVGAVLELDEEALEAGLLEELPLAGLVVTRLEPVTDQAERIRSRRRHSRLARQVRDTGVVVVDGDDSEAELLGAVNLDARSLRFGATGVVELGWEVLRETTQGGRLAFRSGDSRCEFRVSWNGGANHVGAIAASTMAIALGFRPETIAESLEDLGTIPGSLERIAGGPDTVRVWADQARSSADLRQALEVLREVVVGRVICVLGVPDGLAPDAARGLAEVCDRGADDVVLTLDSPSGSTGRDGTLENVLRWFRNPGQVRISPERETAVLAALLQARPGDGVLLAGRGRPVVRRIAGQTAVLDDRELIARAALRGRDDAGRRTA